MKRIPMSFAACAIVLSLLASPDVADTALVHWSRAEKTLEASKKSFAGRLLDLAGKADRPPSDGRDPHDGSGTTETPCRPVAE